MELSVLISLPTAGSAERTVSSGKIVRGPDGNLWFAELHPFDRIMVSGQVTESRPSLSRESEPVKIAAGPDGSPSM
jgi:hypothetical protein